MMSARLYIIYGHAFEKTSILFSTFLWSQLILAQLLIKTVLFYSTPMIIPIFMNNNNTHSVDHTANLVYNNYTLRVVYHTILPL